ncbi:protein PSK SIMULATOR 2-like isoform X2 [Vicia villosa]|uniref:protein PSK SIMULATOR 2-like isoform X2 n=1 Tax=Vicia villosa TaxID=3911 RepID=UPI00273B9204|nr:protein PSK SIMULATOR 2-like isoform X2 [Vicia villosa]
MGSVCSSGKVEKNINGENHVSGVGNLNRLKSFVNRKGNCYSNPKKLNSGFSTELKLVDDTNLRLTRRKQASQRGSFLGRASEKAVEVLDTLGSSLPKLSTSDGFIIGMVPKRNKISMLAFEVANTITRGSILFRSLSEENIQLLKNEILQSEGVQKLVSIDTKELISFVEADKRDEFNIFSREVVRFGNTCKDPQWHNLDRYFLRLDLDALSNKQPRVEAEKTMQDLSSLAQNTAELYHELNALDRFQQDYNQKVKELESLNLPLNGDGLTAFHSELKHQRKLVKSLQRRSLWSKNLEEVVEKLVDIAAHIHHAIFEFLGKNSTIAVKNRNGPQRLGEAGLALHYANIINQINVIASRPTILPPNMRDTLYKGLPKNIKNALPSRLQNDDVTRELSIAQVKAETDKILQWLTPFATNTTKAHQGFGWVGEWANTSNEFIEKIAGKETNLIRLHTLHYADKQKIDFHILELLVLLHHLVSFARYRNNAARPMSSTRTSSPNKGLHFQSKMLQFISLTQLSEEERRLLEEVTTRRWIPGISKSENLEGTKKKEAMVWHFSNSVGSSPTKWLFATKLDLDVMDGL